MADSHPETPSMTTGNKSAPVLFLGKSWDFYHVLCCDGTGDYLFKPTLVCRNSTQHVMKAGVCEYIPGYIAEPRGLCYCSMDRYC